MAHKLRETSEALFAGPESLPNKPVTSEAKEEGKEEASAVSTRHRKKGQLPGRSDSISSQVFFFLLFNQKKSSNSVFCMLFVWHSSYFVLLCSIGSFMGGVRG